MRLSRLAFSLLALLAQPACAESTASSVPAHPAHWVVHGPAGTAFILGSIHALPMNVTWRTPEIIAAAKAAGVYVFEVSNAQPDEDEAVRYIRRHGILENGQTLEAMLSPAARQDYLAACALAGVEPTRTDNKRPWLAAILLTVSYMNQRHMSEANTPDDYYEMVAERTDRTTRYLDTTEEQLEFLARYDQTMGVAGFSAMLGDFTKQAGREDRLVAAWSSGDTQEMAHLIAESFAADPEGAEIFAKHNRGWADQLKDMLATNRSYFVVVGIAHLVGPNGVPALLRADGYRVEGP